ncbi:hypothetical protein MMC27_008388 [Xylographa pallens]|nr:hypothetical protein [Xylographa pallens]
MDRPPQNPGTSFSSEEYEQDGDFVVVDEPHHVKWDGDQTKYIPPKTLEGTVAAAKSACIESAKAAAGSALQVASTVVSEVSERSGTLLFGGDRRDRERRHVQERILEARHLRALDEPKEAQPSHESGDGFEEAKLVVPGLGKDTGDGSSGMKELFTNVWRNC